MNGSGRSRAAPRQSSLGVRSSDPRREAGATIVAALSVLAWAPHPERLGVHRQIAAAGRRCWAYGTAQISEWRRRARDRRELLMLSERELADVGVEIRRARDAAENAARKPLQRG